MAVTRSDSAVKRHTRSKTRIIDEETQPDSQKENPVRRSRRNGSIMENKQSLPNPVKARGQRLPTRQSARIIQQALQRDAPSEESTGTSSEESEASHESEPEPAVPSRRPTRAVKDSKPSQSNSKPPQRGGKRKSAEASATASPNPEPPVKRVLRSKVNPAPNDVTVKQRTVSHKPQPKAKEIPKEPQPRQTRRQTSVLSEAESKTAKEPPKKASRKHESSDEGVSEEIPLPEPRRTRRQAAEAEAAQKAAKVAKQRGKKSKPTEELVSEDNENSEEEDGPQPARSRRQASQTQKAVKPSQQPSRKRKETKAVESDEAETSEESEAPVSRVTRSKVVPPSQSKAAAAKKADVNQAAKNKVDRLLKIVTKKGTAKKVPTKPKNPKDWSYPGREAEFDEILNFLEEKIQNGTGGCMCIAGMPGTGKTATIHRVLEYLASKKRSLPKFDFCEINGMALTEPKQAYVLLAKAQLGKKMPHAKALVQLDDFYRSDEEASNTLIAIIDEMDLLYSKRQKVLYNLMDWPQLPGSKLVVVSIANTLDLPERMFSARIESRMGPQRLIFHPYTSEQLEKVVRFHLRDADLSEEAMLLASKKVAGLSGDARRVLHICTRAKAIASGRESFAAGKIKIEMKDVVSACEELARSPKFIYMKTASAMEKAFLRSIVTEFEQSGMEEARLDRVIDHTQDAYLEYIEQREDPIPDNILVALANRLAAMELIFMETKTGGKFGRRLSLNCSVDDVKFATAIPQPVR